MRKAVFDLGHAGCVSCKRAIEHAGRHIKGVKEIEVDIASHSINLTYEDDCSYIESELKGLVNKIGYEAELVTDTEL